MARIEPVPTPRRDANDARYPEWEVTTVDVEADRVSLIADGWEPIGVVLHGGHFVRVLLRRLVQLGS